LRALPLTEDDTDGGFVEDGEFEGAPGLLLDGVSVGMQHAGMLRLDLIVEFVDVVGLDGDLGAVLGGEFRAGDDVSLCAIPIDHCEVLVAVSHLEAETVDEEVEALFKGVVEDFGNQAEHHEAI